ncbi:glycosyltransferase [Flavobacterium sp. MMLR14_040]|uniref:glycosyltransferase family 2 protein n=1 Tax=Flavobacterium sp. MMLR14_040 TaxID=3093843 RepID=UPI00298F6337|nr:glycosyltransferase [Flavobacterium sp. MMLR14_040]MDW8849263.1 glycosyltransferase [Flavobacterium sp. MMLR14_040]
MPLVSVIVTTYNRKELLIETLNSILSQTFQDFELIVVDNFSNYDFFSHIEGLNESKIKPFQNANNGIIAINRNFGLKKAKGKYIAFCDDDDVWFPNKLERQIEGYKIFQHNSNVLIYSEVLLFGGVAKEEISNRKVVKNINDLIKKNQIALSSTFISNSELLEFDEDPNLVTSEDYALWLKLISNGYLPLFIKDPLVRYRMSSNSAFATISTQVHIKNVYTLIRHVLKNGISGINYLRYFYRINIELFYFFRRNKN